MSRHGVCARRVAGSFRFCSVIAGVMVLSEVECLMMMFGLGASTCGTRYERVALSRNNEVTATAVPAGTSRVPRKKLENWLAVELLRHLFVSPLKAGAIHPEAVKEDGDFASDRHFRLFHADPLRQTNAPRLQR